jgi:glycosyltransferase involved in cell wall biosynthesis
LNFKNTHILIIPGEQLNEGNKLSSIFEINQANALRTFNLNIGFISINLNGSIYKKFKESILNIKLLKKIKVMCALHNIEGFKLIESTGLYFTPSFFKLYRIEQLNAGFKAYKYYLQNFGKPDIIHAHSRFLTSAILAHNIWKKYKIPFVITEHSSCHQRQLISKSEYKKYVQIINDSSFWIVVSESLGKTIMKNFEKFNLKVNKMYSVIPNVVDNRLCYKERIKSEKFVFLNIASLDKNKNHKLLLESFNSLIKNYKNIELRIGGAGPLQSELLDQIDKLKIPNVKLLGLLTREMVSEEISNSDVFVLSSNVETFGVVLIEALSKGKPVVATKCGGPEDILNASNGLLVNINDSIDLTAAMASIIVNYNNYNFELIKKDCLNRFGSDKIAIKLCAVYKKILTIDNNN